MCGIAGFVNKKNNNFEREKLKSMLDLIEYRGPDAAGMFFEKNVALGHRRLAIIDLKESGNQPMTYKERYVVCFNGEIYNYRSIKLKLIDEGYSFLTETDTEIIPAAYDFWGGDCLHHFNGMWSFVIYDRYEGKLFFARDRYGVKPLYYANTSGAFIFGSEIKQILDADSSLNVANITRVWEFLDYGITEKGRETFFKDIYQVEPGQSLEYKLEDDSIVLNKWDDLHFEKRYSSYKDEVEKFHDTFKDSIKLRLQADVPVGSCLSGGIDSSSIVCCASELLGDKRMKTISSCYRREEEAEYDEQEYMDSVIIATNSQSYKIYISFEEVMNELDDIIWHMDEPFTTTSICAQWFVFKKAKECGLTVMLDGQGADEVLGGYSSFFVPILKDFWRNKKIWQICKAVVVWNKGRGKKEKVRPISYVCRAIVRKGRVLLLRATKLLKSNKTASEMTLNAKDVAAKFPYDMKRVNLSLYNGDSLDSFTNDMISVNLRSLLHFEDRNSMAHSIESRVPFLDYRIVEQACRMPSYYKFRNGFTKAILRDALIDVLPKKISKRISKLGFATPEMIWMRENRERYQEELKKSCVELETIVDYKRVSKWFDDCSMNGKMDYLSFRLICLGRWVRIFGVRFE